MVCDIIKVWSSVQKKTENRPKWNLNYMWHFTGRNNDITIWLNPYFRSSTARARPKVARSISRKSAGGDTTPTNSNPQGLGEAAASSSNPQWDGAQGSSIPRYSTVLKELLKSNDNQEKKLSLFHFSSSLRIAAILNQMAQIKLLWNRPISSNDDLNLEELWPYASKNVPRIS